MKTLLKIIMLDQLRIIVISPGFLIIASIICDPYKQSSLQTTEWPVAVWSSITNGPISVENVHRYLLVPKIVISFAPCFYL